MKLKLAALAIIFVCAFALVGGYAGFARRGGTAQNETEPNKALSGRIIITGSNTMAPLVKALAARFQEINPGVEIDVQARGSARGIADVRAGKATLGMFGRAIGDGELDLFGFPIARDGVCLVVHQDNPIKELTKLQVVEICTGKISDWRDVGGPAAPIELIGREEGHCHYELFMGHFQLAAKSVHPYSTVGDHEQSVKAIVENPHGIAYVSIGEGERSLHDGVPIKMLPMAGVAATTENVRRGRFPISRPLTLVSKERPTGAAKAFIEFALSPQATDLIRQQKFVPYID
ncbi:MAG TPA: phosphate ABC transporter substrate-binding protein [Tepidisphaeraceae bacterium]|jgi:phosphate transport system substrate-binding protein|nr:phosphate ABC transporter substrate-binding protein [Tepidisphaeraceae bacterium]